MWFIFHCLNIAQQIPHKLQTISQRCILLAWCLWGGASIVSFFFGSDPTFPGRALSTFIHMFLRKAGPFTLENHIHVKALKRQGFPNNLMPY